ncbi:MAG: DUF790 family protein [Deltaproteobacteria bacterium]|nr:DUF790 family protein [Deltaproteobacteria bacterium]
MLTAELVRVFRRKGSLGITPLCGLSRERAAAMLEELLLLAKEHHGLSRGDLRSAFDDVNVDPREDRALRAAKKLVLDRLEFAARDDVDPVELRAEVFAAGAAARRAGTFDRTAIVDVVAKAHGLSPLDLEAALYADLEDAHVVDAADLPVLGALLVDDWQRLEVQALLLRATEVTLDVDATPAQLRRLLRALKLHQLLFRVDAGALVRLVIDGPMGLFSSSTRYGMKLALLLPHIQACKTWRLQASVQLRKGKAAEEFVVAGKSNVDVDAAVEALPPLVEGLLLELPALLPGFAVAAAQALLPVAGHGALVPDVVVTHPDGRQGYVEVLGFWSRDAVWRRVEQAQAGLLPAPVVFCFSERLRVSEAALAGGGDDVDDASLAAGAALVAFKGSLSARKVAEKVLLLMKR